MNAILRLLVSGLALFALCTPAPAAAQELVLRRDVPAPVVSDCRMMAGPQRAVAVPQDPVEAARLVAAAREAALLGDQRAARDLLETAASADTTAANVAFLLGRTLEELSDADRAVGEYCRYIRLAPDAPDTDEVRQRVSRLARPIRPGIPDTAVARFRAALAFADAGRLDDADAAFSAVIAAAPSWSTPYYDRALVRLRSSRAVEARADLDRYLALEPDSPDAARVRALIDERATPRTYSPGAAFALGLVPGAGHYYTGRPVMGTVLLALAGGAAAAGVLIQERHVECLTDPQNGVCPPDQIRNERIDRPYLLPAAGVAAAATLIGAIDAARGARSRNARAALDAAARVGAAVQVRPSRIDIALLRLRF